jgi:hypothetical protein
MVFKAGNNLRRIGTRGSVVTSEIGTRVAAETALRLSTIASLCTQRGIADEHAEAGLESGHAPLSGRNVIDDEPARSLGGELV